MSHEEVADLLGAFALDAVDSRDEYAVRDHLADCPRCQAELSEYHEVAGLLANVGGEAPPQVWDRIAERVSVRDAKHRAEGEDRRDGNVLRLVRPATPARGRTSTKGGLKKVSRWAMPVATAAALVVIGLLGAQVSHLNSRVGKLDALVASHGMSQVVEAALLDPRAIRIDLTSAGDESSSLGQIIVLPSGTAFMINSDMPGLPDSETYQLWGRADGKAISLSLLGNQPKDVGFTIDPTAHFGGFAITVEPAGGVVSPTTSAVAVGALA